MPARFEGEVDVHGFTSKPNRLLAQRDLYDTFPGVVAKMKWSNGVSPQAAQTTT